MDENLLKYLEENGMEYITHLHEAVFTVDEAEKVDRDLPGLHTKNLFLTDKYGKFWLVCMDAYKRLNIKQLEKDLGCKKLSFASPDLLKEKLNLTPGSVSLFGMIYADENVFLVLEKAVAEAEITGFHPNINTATLEIDQENLQKFVKSLRNEVIVVEMV